MSRTIMRVPLDFKHPLDEVWPGYLRECADEECDGCGECEKQEPPEGDGWQVWETVSEGSPISPVFSSDEECARWVSEDEFLRCSMKTARAFVADGYALSLIGTSFGLFKGVQLAAGLAEHLEFLEREAGNDYIPTGTRVRHSNHGVDGTVEHIIPRECVQGTDDRYYLVTWDRGIPGLLEPGDDPAAPMKSGVRADSMQLIEPEDGAR